MTGRIVTEALVGGRPVKASRKVQASLPAANGLKTILDEQIVGPTVYFDAAGFPGRAGGPRAPLIVAEGEFGGGNLANPL